MARATSISKLQTGNADLDRVQEHLRQQLNPVLASLPSASDFRWVQLPGADQTVADSWALQFRTAGTTWTTIVSVTSAGQIVQPAWTAPALLNSYAIAGSRPVGYFKESCGIIHLRGTVTGGVADTIFTLPTGFRPPQAWIFATDHNGAYGRVIVQTTGNVDSDLTLHTNVVLDGITFDTRS